MELPNPKVPMAWLGSLAEVSIGKSRMNSVGLRRSTLAPYAVPEFGISESTSCLSLVFLSLAEATSGHKASPDRSMHQAARKFCQSTPFLSSN